MMWRKKFVIYVGCVESARESWAVVLDVGSGREKQAVASEAPDVSFSRPQ